MNNISKISGVLTILGCGGSWGVPQINCDCPVCVSDNPKNIRTRASILLDINGYILLIDASPDLRTQALKNNIFDIDGIFITHDHYDHIGGLSDIKGLLTHYTRENNIIHKSIPIFMDNITGKSLINKNNYLIASNNDLYPNFLQPQIYNAYSETNTQSFDAFNHNIAFSIIKPKITIHTMLQKHGEYFSYGIRVGNLAYCTDLTEISAQGYQILQDVEILIIDCLRHAYAPTHLSLGQTLDVIAKVNPTKAILTHMSHELDYDWLKNNLPARVVPAYDGMQLEFEI